MNTKWYDIVLLPIYILWIAHYNHKKNYVNNLFKQQKPCKTGVLKTY